MSNIRNNWLLISLCVVLQVFLVVVLSRTYLLYHNTLHNNASWISAKMNLEKNVMGAFSFFYGPQALAEGHLNLGSWHGFQEVLYKEKLNVGKIEFDFRLERNSYLNVIYNKSESGFSCIRFSVNEHFHSGCFKVTPAGRFLEKKTLDALELRARHWHHAELDFEDEKVSLMLDDRIIESFNEQVLREQRIGFRGGLLDAYVDDVLFHRHNSGRIFESFGNSRASTRLIVFIVLLVGVFNLLIFVLLRFVFRVESNYRGYSLATLNAVLIIIGLFISGHRYMTANRYPRFNEQFQNQEQYLQTEMTREVVQDIRDAFGDMPGENFYRVLFLGSSQTWGAGASKQSMTFVSKFEKKLNGSGIPGTRFECMNAGVPGLQSSSLLDLYWMELLNLKPGVVVINLSNNDGDSEQFASNLQTMIEVSRRDGIQPVFVLEANSVEASDNGLKERHEAMRRVGAAHKVPVIDMHAYLGRKYDDGFLWWDKVHLTDFGHELFAGKIYEELLHVIKNNLVNPADLSAGQTG